MKTRKNKKFEEVPIPTDSDEMLCSVQLSETSITRNEGTNVSDAATIILTSKDGQSMAAHFTPSQLKYLMGRCSSILSTMRCD